MKRNAVFMMMLSAVLTLGTAAPAYAAAEEAVTESVVEETDSKESSLTEGVSSQENALPDNEVDGSADTDSETVQDGRTETGADSVYENEKSENQAEGEINDEAKDTSGKEKAEASGSEAADASESVSEEFVEGNSDIAADAASDSSSGSTEKAEDGSAVAKKAVGLQILSLSDNVYGKTGTSVSFHIEAFGDGNVSYQWQYKLAGSSKWKSPALASAKTQDYTFTLRPSYDNIEVHCIVTDQAGNTVVSESRYANVFALTDQPVSATVAEGQTVNFEVDAIGQDLSYQWYFRRPGGSWKKAIINSANTDSLVITGSEVNNGTSYRCVVRDSEGNSITSSTAVLTVQPAIEIAGISDDYYGKNGTKASFHIDASAANGTLTYRWQYKTAGSSTWKTPSQASAKTADYSFTLKPSYDDIEVRCIVSDGAGHSRTSEVRKANVFAITVQPQDSEILIGAQTTFSVESIGDGLTYQWYYKRPSGSWKKVIVSGYNTPVLPITGKTANNGTQYRCRVTDAYGNYLTSNSAVLTVNEPPVEPDYELAGLYYDQLSTEEQDIYSQVYSAIASHQTDFYVQASDLEGLDDIVQCVMKDHPEFFWLSGEIGISGTSGPGLKRIVLSTNIALSMIDSQQTMIDSEAGAYLSMISEDMSDYDKVRIAYEFVVNSNDYVLDSEQNQNIQSSMIYHQSVCSGYAKEMQYLLNEAGIFCAVVEGNVLGEDGNTEPHAWNLVLIDGEYTFVDATWGDPYYGGEPAGDRPTISYSFLCMTSDELARLGYQADPGYTIPQVSSNTWDYYVLNGWYVGSYDRDTARSVIFAQIDSGSDFVHLKFADEDSYLAAMNDIFNSDFTNEIFQYKADASQIYEFEYGRSTDDALYTIDIRWIY